MCEIRRSSQNDIKLSIDSLQKTRPASDLPNWCARELLCLNFCAHKSSRAHQFGKSLAGRVFCNESMKVWYHFASYVLSRTTTEVETSCLISEEPDHHASFVSSYCVPVISTLHNRFVTRAQNVRNILRSTLKCHGLCSSTLTSSNKSCVFWKARQKLDIECALGFVCCLPRSPTFRRLKCT